jgi:hypothetical protein
MPRIFSAAVTAVLLAWIASAGSAVSAERVDGVRNGERIDISSVRRHAKKAKRTAAPREDRNSRREEPYAGYRTDFAGNSYFYYRPGGPFGPGKGLRSPYPN